MEDADGGGAPSCARQQQNRNYPPEGTFRDCQEGRTLLETVNVGLPPHESGYRKAPDGEQNVCYELHFMPAAKNC
jgi:hypothetical protein